LPIDYSLDLVDNDYIVFVSPEDTLKVKEETVEEVKKSSSITVNTSFVVDESAELDLIMPFDMGNISGRGNGDLQINYDENGELSINGEYRIQKGKYQMNLQGVLRKEFSLLPNSTITWTGDPYDADINIRAAYDLRARLGEYARTEDSATVVPVQCIMENSSGALYVFTVQNDKLQLHQVNKIMESESKAEVTGIEPGAQVITSTFLGWANLSDGLKVEVAK